MPRLVIRKGANKGDVISITPAMKTKNFGRLLDCDYTILDNLVSRKQFSVHFEGEAFVVTDLGSHNGTFHNGKKMTEPIPLHPGDRIACGSTLFSFDDDESDEAGKLTGKKIGGYRCIRRLGVGGMGEVYLAQQLTLGREVAIKLLFADRMKDQTQTQRFILEARNAGRLDHPNVIHVYDIGEAEGMYYYSMELVSGGSVEDLISGGKRVRPLETVELIMEAVSALDYAERKGIIHCDIKPANLMLTEDGHIRLADLGISKQTDEKGQADQKEGVYGSPHYMSPEQCRGEILDHRTDQYSLGVVAYRMLSGRFPFDGTTARNIMEKHVFDTLEGLEALVPNDVPALLCQIVNRMLDKDKTKRFPTFRDLQEELVEAKRAIKAGKAPPSRIQRLENNVPQRKQSFRWFHVIIAIVIIVVVALIWYLTSVKNIDIVEELKKLF